jgi:hypothetical protein
VLWKDRLMPDLDLGARSAPFMPGDTVAIVEVLNGQVWTVRPVTVLRDTPEEIAVWLAPGTLTRYPTGPQHGQHTVQHWLAGAWDLGTKVWGPPGKLRLSRPGDPFDVWMSPRSAPGSPEPWYVNLQEPLRRVNAGFTTMDHILDILVAPDLTSWEWKDEDEFDYAREAGLLSPIRAAAIRETGYRIIKDIESGQPPWNLTWATWTPPT